MKYSPPFRKKKVGRNHYYVDSQDRKIPGVTSILGDGVPKPALLNWAANTTAAYAVDRWEELGDLSVSERLSRLKKCRYEDRDAAARRGTEVHALAERLQAGEAVVPPEELRGHVESYARFLDDSEMEVESAERPVANFSIGYAGTFDILGRVRQRDELGILDIKTSRSGIFGETALQLAAYAHAELMLGEDGEMAPMPPPQWGAAIHVRGDGYSFHVVDISERTLRIFRYAQQMADFAANGSQLIGEGIQVNG